MNNVSIIGRLTKDIELKYTGSGKAVCDFSVAISKYYTKDGEKKEETCFMPVQCWDRMAENLAKYVFKGDKIAIIGSLKQDRWEDDNGIKRSKIYVIALEIEFIETKRRNQNQEQECPTDEEYENMKKDWE